MIARRIGVQIAQLVRDIQEKYNGAVVFYQTGKLAIETSKWWEKYDSQFQVTKRMDVLKKTAMERAVKFNSEIVTKWSTQGMSRQIVDSWNFLMAAPINAVSIDNRSRLSSSITRFGRGVVSTTAETLQELMDRGSDIYEAFSEARRKRSSFTRRNRSTGKSWISIILGSKSSFNPRGNHVNPWDSPLKYLLPSERRTDQSNKGSRGQSKRNKRPQFSSSF
jgi:hypothetical protein